MSQGCWTFFHPHGYTKEFASQLLYPMLSVVCTCSYAAVDAYPASIVVDYFANKYGLSGAQLRAYEGTRDVVDRIASGYRWQLLERREKTAAVERKRGVEALNVNRYVTARLDGGRRPLGEAGRAGKFFSYAHVKYLHGLSAELCAKEAFEVHLLCTEHLTEELHRLGRVFTGQDIRARKSNSRSKEQPITWVAASRIDADLAARLRTLYREDDMIHEWVCSRYSSTQATPGQNSSASGTHLHARA